MLTIQLQLGTCIWRINIPAIKLPSTYQASGAAFAPSSPSTKQEVYIHIAGLSSPVSLSTIQPDLPHPIQPVRGTKQPVQRPAVWSELPPTIHLSQSCLLRSQANIILSHQNCLLRSTSASPAVCHPASSAFFQPVQCLLYSQSCYYPDSPAACHLSQPCHLPSAVYFDQFCRPSQSFCLPPGQLCLLPSQACCCHQTIQAACHSAYASARLRISGLRCRSASVITRPPSRAVRTTGRPRMAARVGRRAPPPPRPAGTSAAPRRARAAAAARLRHPPPLPPRRPAR